MRGEAELRHEYGYAYTILKKHHLLRVSPKQLCTSAHLVCTRAAGTYQCFTRSVFNCMCLSTENLKLRKICFLQKSVQFFTVKAFIFSTLELTSSGRNKERSKGNTKKELFIPNVFWQLPQKLLKMRKLGFIRVEFFAVKNQKCTKGNGNELLGGDS